MTQLFTNFAAIKCSHFLGFPTWYEYIHASDSCSNIQITGINDIWLIVAAAIEILLRVAGIFAVAFVIYGGFQYITSQAEPEKVTRAKHTIINALIGLLIAILASVIVNFIAGSIK
jgi:ABC-type Fe3+ transport system permease subunit